MKFGWNFKGFGKYPEVGSLKSMYKKIGARVK
jgi:hypothetical protein